MILPPSAIFNRFSRLVTERPSWHQPGENIENQPPGLDRRVLLDKLACLFHRCSEDRDPAQRFVGLAGNRSRDQRVSFRSHTGIERKMILLEGVELLVRHLRGIGWPPEKDDSVRVELHALRSRAISAKLST